MSRSYPEAQFSTPSARAMIRSWLDGRISNGSQEEVARYMRDTLRIGGIKACRELVRSAVEETPIVREIIPTVPEF